MDILRTKLIPNMCPPTGASYEAYDAYVSWTPCYKIDARSDPIFHAPEQLQPDDHVRLYLNGGNDGLSEKGQSPIMAEIRRGAKLESA